LECYTCTARIYRLGAESNDLEITVQESMFSEFVCFTVAGAAREPARRQSGLVFAAPEPTDISVKGLHL
jgi:hypothetical protein